MKRALIITALVLGLTAIQAPSHAWWIFSNTEKAVKSDVNNVKTSTKNAVNDVKNAPKNAVNAQKAELKKQQEAQQAKIKKQQAAQQAKVNAKKNQVNTIKKDLNTLFSK
ncbi:MAG: hypothetical protein K6A44_04135 [bacterium]|nr:hypothetical protein [bacterium]